ncbi:MAG TPA: rRNA maturation RNase YbeY [Bryobacteraceae bacterium]|nr:rRNA maturation RNase YbeY [Bryobacteraceae bacterium]
MHSSEPLVLFRRAPTRARRMRIEHLARTIRAKVAGRREFLVLVTDDRELRRLNAQFLGKNYPTDVLSFRGANGSRSLGELAISIERAREQARAFGHPLEEEVGILMLHGVLHLAGMDHERDNGRMARAEALWRKKLGLPTGLIERARV